MQTPATHTPKQVAHSYETPAVLPVGELSLLLPCSLRISPQCKLKRLDKYTKLHLLHFSGTPSEDAQVFLRSLS